MVFCGSRINKTQSYKYVNLSVLDLYNTLFHSIHSCHKNHAGAIQVVVRWL